MRWLEGEKMNRVLQGLFALCAFGVMAATPVYGQAGEGQSAAQRYPSGSIASLANAQEALDAVAAERQQIEARFVQEKAACMEKFFVTSCVDEAKERRRQALEPLTSVELEAKRFQRQDRALQRDRDVAEKQARAAEEAAQAAATEPRVKLPKPEPEPEPLPPAEPREERVRPGPTPEQEREAARERAENEAAYAQKVQAAKERQEAVVRRKAEKERKRAAHGNAAATAPASPEGK